jgi:F0F1-type ATP synthase membrane subunit c/vacuolar-type H+-ATPase subunit K
VIHLLGIKNKAIVTAIAMVGSVLFMGLTFWLYAEKLGSQPTEFYGLVYVAGFAPALIIGLIYGLVVSILLDRRRASERSLQVISPRREGR